MNVRVACHDWAVRRLAWRAGKVRDYPACLTHEQQPRCDVPWREYQLPESIEPPTCNVGKIERS